MVLLTFPILLSLAAFGVGWGSALRIEIQPPKYAEGSSGPVNVSCQIDHQDSDGDEDFMVKIMKDGEKPLVVLRPSGIQLGSGVNTSKFLTEGHIYQKDISTSYIKLGILDPSSQDEGKYTCFMHFIDKHHQVSDRRASAFLKSNLNDVVMMLRGQVATLEGKDSDQQREIDGLHKENRNQKKMMKDMAATEKELRSKMSGLEQKDNAIERSVAGLGQQVAAREAKDSVLSAFSLSISHLIGSGFRGTIKFDKVVYMYGSGYSSSTGKFTAPLAGLYAFHISTATWCSHCRTYVHIFVRNKQKATIFVGAQHVNIQASTSTVVALKKGDVVDVRKTYNGILEDYPFTMFNGYLIKAF